MTFPLKIPPRDGKTWIQTYTGKQAWPLNPHPDDIDIEDIAHALALQCRYTGHTKFHYSVAQHCVLMSRTLEDQELALWALLHDASEAYLCDIARPIKGHLYNYQVYEDMLMRVVADKFQLSWPMPPEIKDLDLVMLATECRDLMRKPPIPWCSTANVAPLEMTIKKWTWEWAEESFLLCFKQLQRKT